MGEFSFDTGYISVNLGSGSPGFDSGSSQNVDGGGNSQESGQDFSNGDGSGNSNDSRWLHQAVDTYEWIDGNGGSWVRWVFDFPRKLVTLGTAYRIIPSPAELRGYVDYYYSKTDLFDTQQSVYGIGWAAYTMIGTTLADVVGVSAISKKRWCQPFIDLLFGVVIIGGGGSQLVRN